MTQPNTDDYSVTRDVTATSRFLDQVRAVAPACVVCGRPSGYRDVDGNPSHTSCSGESTEEKRLAKIAQRGGKIASNAGPVDVGKIIARAEQHAEGPRQALDADERAQRVARARREVTRNPNANRPEIIARMSAREIFDLGSIRVDAMDSHSEARELIARARRANELAYYPTAHGDQEAAKAHVDDLLRRSDDHWKPSLLAKRMILTCNPTYRSAFAKALTACVRNAPPGFGMTVDEQRAVDLVSRALQVGTGSLGGYAVPADLDPTIVNVSTGSANPFRRVCTVRQTTSNEWRGLTSGGATAQYQPEATEAVDNAPTLAQPAFTLNRATSFIPVSLELAQDWEGMLNALGDLILDAKDDLEAVKFATGSGTGEPQGLITGATSTVNAGAAAVAPSHLYGLEQALPARFRERAVIFANRVILNDLLQDANTGAAVWLPLGATKIDPGSGYSLIGYPFGEASGMASTLTTGSKVAVIFDPRAYVIVDHPGIDLELTGHLFGSNMRPTGQRGVYGFWRNTAGLVNPAAARVLVTT